MSFTLDLKDGEETPRPVFFELQDKISLILEEMQESGASLEEKKAILLATLASNHWSVEDYGTGLLFWLGVSEFQDVDD